jgi:intracellular sulfur oxidation DsrE/DsrF family protein
MVFLLPELNMKHFPMPERILLSFLMVCLAGFAGAQERLTPAIEGYGGVVYLPEAAEQLDPAREYRLIFNVTEAGRGDDATLPGLEAAARFLNLAALAHVPKENVHIVMAIHGAGTPHALSNERFNARYGRDNPSLDLINKLSDYGVDIYVCGQAMAGFGFAHDETSAKIEVAAAALTVLANYQMAGYALMSN